MDNRNKPARLPLFGKSRNSYRMWLDSGLIIPSSDLSDPLIIMINLDLCTGIYICVCECVCVKGVLCVQLAHIYQPPSIKLL